MFATIAGRILGALGLMAAVLYGFMLWLVPDTAGASWVGATAAVGLASWVYLDWEALAGLFGSKGGREQISSWVLIAVVFTICLFVMHIAGKNPKRLDLTEARIHSLDAKTIQILEDVPEDLDVSVQGFFIASFDAMEAGKERAFQRLLDAANATNTDVTLELIDPELAPLLASQLGITSNGTVVVTAKPRAGGPERTERLYSPDEQEIANALLRVMKGKRARVVFLEGHGERTPATAGERGLSLLAQQLKNLGFKVGTWNSVTQPAPPDGMSVLVIGGPQQKLDPREASIIREWVEEGGSLMLLAEPAIPEQYDGRTGLEGALLTWGLELRDDLVLDPMMSRLGGDPAAPIADTFGFHEITSGFDLPVVFVTARSVAENNTLPEQVTTFALAKTGDEAWGETNLESEEIDFDEADFEGPVMLIGLAELHRPTTKARGRLIVAGDVDWLTDGLVVSRGNLDFGARSIGWLAKEADVVELPPREATADTMELSLLQILLMGFISVFVMPAGSAVTGAIVWMWRRGL
ncbi:MAG: GldG family protein [Proteobacteria bacterium]|nr:GldG family protein [Pseudomonadota bacterium]